VVALPIPRKHACSFLTSQIAPSLLQKMLLPYFTNHSSPMKKRTIKSLLLNLLYRSFCLHSNYRRSESSLPRITTSLFFSNESCDCYTTAVAYWYVPFDPLRRRMKKHTLQPQNICQMTRNLPDFRVTPAFAFFKGQAGKPKETTEPQNKEEKTSLIQSIKIVYKISISYSNKTCTHRQDRTTT
jgi:hypothetical protein